DVQERKLSNHSVTWLGLMRSLNAHFSGMHLDIARSLPGIHPGLVPSPQGPRLAWRPSRLLDVLYLQLATWATANRSLRRCPECKSLFAPERTNQRYCS